MGGMNHLEMSNFDSKFFILQAQILHFDVKVKNCQLQIWAFWISYLMTITWSQLTFTWNVFYSNFICIYYINPKKYAGEFSLDRSPSPGS